MSSAVLGGRGRRIPASIGLVVAAILVALTAAAHAPTVASAAPADAGSDSLLTPEQEAWLDERDRTVVLGTDDTYRPYVFFDESGDLTGITADYVALLEDRLDITIEARRLPGFSEMLDAAEAREIDIVPNVVASDERPYLVFTEPYVVVVDQIIVRSDDEDDYDLADLAGWRVASVDGYAVTDQIDADFPEIEVVRFDTEVAGLRALSVGEVDALVADLGVVSYAVQQEGITNLRVAGTVDSVSEQRFGVRSDEPVLRDIIDAGLRAIGEGERDEITRRWIQLGTSDSSSTPLVLWIVGLVGLVSAFVAIGVVAWNRSLRRSVERSTAELRHELAEHERTEAQRSRLELAIAQAAELVAVVDADWSVRYLNPTYERVSGRSVTELEGRPLDELLATATDRDTLDDARPILARDGVWRGRPALAGRDGSPIPVEGAIAAFTMPSGEPGGYVLTLRDVRQEERLRAELYDAERLKSVGTLAAGIAHDFNNLLTPILSGAELAAATDDRERRARYLASIQEAALRASDLVRQVRSFSQEREVEPEEFDVRAVVDEAIELVRSTCSESVTIEVDLAAEPVIVHAAPSQVHQLVMNLLTNSLQAMEPAGGRLGVAVTSRTSVDAANGLAPADVYAELTVSDTGVGIDEATRQRLFEPYFSTRAETGGTGLGLFTVAGIVRSLGGSIDVRSEVGVGTSSSVILPAVEGALATDPEPDEADSPPPASGRILVVDDEDMVLSVLTSLLEQVGYDVTACASGSEALEAIEGERSFDLLLTDLGMPEMRGDELARLAAERRPELPVLLLTGHNDSSAVGAEWSVLTKPVSMARLDAAVRDAMRRDPPT